MKIVPEQRPSLSKQDAIKLVQKTYPDFKIPSVFWLGIRGYWEDSLYPDAIFIVAKDEFIPFNANTNPLALQKGIYNLVPGVYPAYKFDKHKGAYIALCQRADKVTVVKDGKKLEGMYGINIHRGGSFGGSLSGSHTIPPSQWEDFITSSMRLARKYAPKTWDRDTYTYILVEI